MAKLRAVLASENEHKLRELRGLLPEWELEPLRGADYPEEAGATFYENALAKARFARELAPADVWVLGEDSGLEVAGLGGGPGIRSARYAGEGASDETNVEKLLGELEGVAGEGRRARYVSELVGIAPTGANVRGTGTFEGSIAAEPRGAAGFGYDPVFLPAGKARTVAELGDAWKARHSHRSRAARAFHDRAVAL